MGANRINFSDTEIEEIWAIRLCESETRPHEEIQIKKIQKAIEQLSNDQPFYLQEFLNDLMKHKLIIENSIVCITLLARLVCLSYVNNPTKQLVPNTIVEGSL